MASFNQSVVTTDGLALLFKVSTSTEKLVFTKICTSSKKYEESENLQELSSLPDIKQTSIVSGISILNDVSIKIEGGMSNSELSEGYYVNTIGLFADDPDLGEILYSVTTAVQADWMPANDEYSSSSILIQIITEVSNSAVVQLEVSPAALATVNDFNNLQFKINESISYIGYTSDDIYGVEVDYTSGAVTRLAGAVGKNQGTGFDDVLPFGGRRKCNLSDGGVVNAYAGDSNYAEDGSNGQVMIEQPKFYYRTVPLSLEKNEAPDIILLQILTGATADGTITINLNGTEYEVPVSETDNENYKVAAKIENIEFDSWTAERVTPTQLRFICSVPGATTGLTVDAGTTEVSTAVTQSQYGYIGKGFKARKIQYYVSPTKKEGFNLHPAFVQNGVEKNHIYLSAFEGSLFDVSSSSYVLDDAQVADFADDKLSSISGAKPVSGKTQKLTRTNCRALASNRGSGWSLQTMSVLACSQMLYLIEYANLDSQVAVGTGITSGNNTGENLAALTGSELAVTYRGEENLWGNIEKMLDGANVYCDVDKEIQEIFIADSGFADGSGSVSYTNADITMTSNRGYITAMAYSQKSDWLFVPAETVSGPTESTVKDRYNPKQKHDSYVPNESSEGFKVPLSGGNWFSGNNAGIFSLTTIKDEPYNSNSLGARLVYVPTDTAGLMPTGTNTVKALESLPKSPAEEEVFCLTQEGTVPLDQWEVLTDSSMIPRETAFHESRAPLKYWDVDITGTPALKNTVTKHHIISVSNYFEPDLDTLIFYGTIPEITSQCALLIIKDLPPEYHSVYGETLKLFYAQEGTFVEGVTEIEETGWYRGIDPEDPEDPTIIQPISETPAELLEMAKINGCYLYDAYNFFEPEDRDPQLLAVNSEILANIAPALKLGIDNGLYQFKSGEWHDLTYKPYILLMAKED